MNNTLERQKQIYQVLHRRFIVLRKRHVFGVFPVLFCTLREEIDGLITEKRLKCKIRRYGAYPYYFAYLDVVVNDVKQSYFVDKYAYAHLNFQDKPVWFRMNNPQSLLVSV